MVSPLISSGVAMVGQYSSVTVVLCVVQCHSVHKLYMYRYINTCIIVHYHAHC